MKTTVEPLEGNKVKVSVEVDEGEFAPEIDDAFKRIAREVRIPGFRPGKVPRKILEARIGTEAARADALQHALPEYYAKAVTEHDVDVIAPPEIDITSGEEDGPVAFDAVVEVRPRIVVGGYASLRVTIDRPVADDEEIDHRIGHLRENFATLATVDRPAIDSDSVTIDISGTQGDEPMPGLTAEGYLYEVGSGTVVPELDEQLRGAKPGDILEFTADHPDPEQEPVAFRVLVKEVKERVLPDLDDDWASEASEFDTLAELRADVANRIVTMKKIQAQMALRERTGDALAELVDDEVPEALVAAEMQERMTDMAMRLQAQGMELGQYLAATGADQEQFVGDLRSTAEKAVRVDLALRSVAEAEGIEVTDDDIDAEVQAVAERVGQKPAAVLRQLERNDQMPLVRSDIKKRKALEWLLEHVEVVDEAGEPIDRDLLEMAADEASDDHDHDHHDHDHDHDHDHHDHDHDETSGDDEE